MKEHSRANQRDKILGINRSIAKNLLRCWCLRGLKDLPCIPSALPILFLGPTLRFQEMKIGRRVPPFAKMTGGKERIINATVLNVRAIKVESNGIVIGPGLGTLIQSLNREIWHYSRKLD